MSSEHSGLRHPWGVDSYNSASTSSGGLDSASDGTNDYPETTAGGLGRGGSYNGYVSVPAGMPPSVGPGDSSGDDGPYFRRPTFVRRSRFLGLGGAARGALVASCLVLLSLAAFTAGVHMGQTGLEHSFSRGIFALPGAGGAGGGDVAAVTQTPALQTRKGGAEESKKSTPALGRTGVGSSRKVDPETEEGADDVGEEVDVGDVMAGGGAVYGLSGSVGAAVNRVAGWLGFRWRHDGGVGEEHRRSR